MKRSKKIGTVMHKLLIEKCMDGFTVLEARDEVLSSDDVNPDLIETRKTVYRQILRFESNNWLYSEGVGRNKRYFQTALFKEMLSSDNEVRTSHSHTTSNYEVLANERSQYQAELEITLNEIDEWQSLISRFPALKDKVSSPRQEAKTRSALLLGKINVLTHTLKLLSEDDQSC